MFTSLWILSKWSWERERGERNKKGWGERKKALILVPFDLNIHICQMKNAPKNEKNTSENQKKLKNNKNQKNLKKQ